MLWNISKSNRMLGILKRDIPNNFSCPDDCCNQCDTCLRMYNLNKENNVNPDMEVNKNGCNN